MSLFSIKNKNILVLGLGISGVSTVKALNELKANIIVSDIKSKEELSDYLKELRNIDINYKLGTNNVNLDKIDLIVKSPGIPLDLKIVKQALSLGIEVITDLELTYRLFNNQIIALTGTNGKTTTTTLVGEMFKQANINCKIAGNIGVGILWEAVNSSPKDIFVVEASSFQLESTKHFKPCISVIINITPDHIKWHKNFNNYVNAKKKILVNQDINDYTILNYDDKICRSLGTDTDSNVLFFSKREQLAKGVYLQDGMIVINDGKKESSIMKCDEISILGEHNLENALASVCVGWALGLNNNHITTTLKKFKGVEHRLEYVSTIDEISFYNDSKGTNPDSSINAIKALKSPIVLIAGGYDKGSNFDSFIQSFDGKVKSLILLGQTAKKIETTAIKKGFKNIYIVDTMQEAVRKAYEVSKANTNVLLSPACASWGMYKNFEERGRHFKELVKIVRRLDYA